MDWYHISNTDELDTPALIIYPERVKANIQLAIEMAGGPNRLRPHVKTHKSPDTTRLMLEAGIHQFKCATIAEAEMLAMTGAKDVLLAYQPLGPKARRLAALIQKFPATRFACLVDNQDAALSMGAIFAAADLQVPVYLDLNIGMNRTGIEPGPAALELYKTAAHTPGITPVGLHAYDGHIRDADWNQRKAKCDAAFARVVALQQEIVTAFTGQAALTGDDVLVTAAPFPAPLIVAGGSPTFSVHCKRKEDIECSPGTFIYWDKGYSDACPEQHFLPAALVLTRVVSLPAPDRACLDLGHKSIAAENELPRRVHFLNAAGLKPVGQSEEHLVVETASTVQSANSGLGSPASTLQPTGGEPDSTAGLPPASLQPGDILYGMPFHVCPTIALYERAYTIENGKVSGEWRNIARDRTITI